jgi:capsular polysaccharide export protein
MTALRVALPAVVHAHGMSLRKIGFLREFVAPTKVVALGDPACLPADGVVLLWGRSEAPAGLPSTVRVVRVEDGFLRSVGLGADLVRPRSLAFDTRGIYFDATTASDLEHLLQHASFDDAMLARARTLRERVVVRGTTKYNVGGAPWVRPAHAKRVVLVPGQVESDASLAFGSPRVRRNMDLLRAARAADPHAYIVYKPHPDVVAGLRGAGAGEDGAAKLCDEVIADAPMGALLPLVDAVQVMTSQTGFEALLRGKEVTCHGQPFFAGWGLTCDTTPLARRTRRLTLDELVAGTYLAYPTYVSGRTGQRTTAEAVLDELEAESARKKTRFERFVDQVLRPVARVFLRRP